MIVHHDAFEHFITSNASNYEYTPSGIRLTDSIGNVSKKAAINDLSIQNLAVAKALELLGDEAWEYGYKSRRRCNKIKSILEDAQDACKYKVPYRTFLRWFQHFLQYGETPAATRRRGGVRALRGIRSTSFTASDNAELDRIIKDKPYLYLDEIQKEMKEKCNGKLWHTSTLWRQMRRRKYSLQKAVFRARQQSEDERIRFMLRLQQNSHDPKQFIIIDEAHKSKNEARRDRAWSMQGVTPVLDAYFDQGFLARYTLIGAADIDGFVVGACDIVEREHGDNDTNPNRGTVDTAKFEAYIENKLVPNLGNYALREPHSIVVFDNAIIHISPRIRKLIEDAGALLINTAPYSPDLNPIEYFFSVYKKCLKRISFGKHWIDAHMEALASVKPEYARNTFRKCGWPGCEDFGKEEDAMTSLAMVCLPVVVGASTAILAHHLLANNNV